MNLTPFDLQKASLARGTVLLEASAGTGKTYTLVGVLLRMLLEGVVERLDQVLVVTFTVAATEELKTRLRDALWRTLRAADGEAEDDPFFVAMAAEPNAKARVRAAIDDFDQVVVATIHGFCKRVLEEAAFESHEPFELEFTADPVPLLYRAAADALRATYESEVSCRSALLHSKNLKPQKLVESYQLWQRHALLPMNPAEPNPTAMLAALQARVDDTVAEWSEAVLDLLVNMEWRKGDDLFGENLEAGLVTFAERLRRHPMLVLHQLLEMGPSTMLKEHVRQTSKANLDHPFFRACAVLAEAAEETFAHVRADLLLRMHERVALHKQRLGTSSFDDLLVRTHRALHDADHGQDLVAVLQQRYRVALIDEFQDTDALQYEIFATAFTGGSLFLIGDPKQSIYRFRGADLHTYKKARDAADRRHTLGENHRSSPQMVDAVGALFARPGAFADEAITMPPVRARARHDQLQITGDGAAVLRWRFVAPEDGGWLQRDDAEERITDDIAAEIARLLRSEARLDGRPLRPNDFAVLTRSNRQAVLVQATLRAAGIPSAIGKAGDVFLTDELLELQLFLHSVLQPGDPMRLRGALTTRLCGHDLTSLLSLEGDDARFDDEIARFDRWRRLWLRSGFVPMVEQALHELGVVRRFLAMPGGERRLTNLRQLFELLHDAEHGARLSPEGLFEWLQHERKHKDELDYTLRELRLESDGDAVQILTVHGSKGLQYEVVFCPFLWEGRDPTGAEIVADDEGDERLVFDLNEDPDDKCRAQAERLAEDLRLAYVALTRSKRRCYLHWGPIGSSIAPRSPLAWLLTPKPRPPGRGADGAPAANWVKQAAEQAKEVDAPRWLADLQQRCADSEGRMSVDVVPENPTVQRLSPAAPDHPLSAPRNARKKRAARGLHSFTSIVAGAPPLEPLADVVDPALPADAQQPATGIFGFARGAHAGQCLHTILEHVDWNALDGDATRQLVQETLSAHDLAVSGAHPGELGDPVATVQLNLRDLAAARVHAHGPQLATLCSGRRVAEWEFVLPMPHAGVQTLADCLAARSEPFARQQAERLRGLGTDTLRGFLTGFVDLVAEHDGRYWVLDWKSNHLGDTLADYGDPALHAAMVHHDYVLQYHLYVLALHRHLRSRLPDYDPERHLGGVCYAFLRGASPDRTTGMFHDLVPVRTVRALDHWLTGGDR